MDITFTGVITKVATPEKVVDKNGQPNGATRYRFLVEEQMQQYPDSVVVEIYDKTSDGSAITNAFQALGVQNPLQVGTLGTFHIHLRGSLGVSQKTGKEYAMNDSARLWKVEPCQGTTAAPQQVYAPQPQQAYAPQPQQQYNPAAQTFAPQQPQPQGFAPQQPFPGQQPQFGGPFCGQPPF